VTSEKSVDTAQRLDGIVAAGGAWPLVAASYPVGGDTPRTATSILDDPILTVPVVNGNVYEIRCEIRYAGGAGGAAGFLQWLWNHPGGSFRINTHYFGTGGTLLEQALLGSTTGVAAFTNGVGTDLPLSGRGLYVCAGTGPLTFQWGCQTNTGTNTHVKEGSYLIAQQIG
jgi:hypothetical protein